MLSPLLSTGESSGERSLSPTVSGRIDKVGCHLGTVELVTLDCDPFPALLPVFRYKDCF